MVNGLVFFGIVVVVLLQLKIYQIVSGRRNLHPGDIVLYMDPNGSNLNNMITEVLQVFTSHGTAQIRSRGNTLAGSTTVVVATRHLQLLSLDRKLPIQVPTEPVPGGLGQGEGDYRWNQAKWAFIPLDWFRYLAPPLKTC